MAAKRNLGMGLDLLLAPAGTAKNRSSRENEARMLFEQALNADENGNCFEAYYYYRRVWECLDKAGGNRDQEIKPLASRAMNNAGVILFENSLTQAALELLRQAVKLHPENAVAGENLSMILKTDTEPGLPQGR